MSRTAIALSAIASPLFGPIVYSLGKDSAALGEIAAPHFLRDPLRPSHERLGKIPISVFADTSVEKPQNMTAMMSRQVPMKDGSKR